MVNCVCVCQTVCPFEKNLVSLATQKWREEMYAHTKRQSPQNKPAGNREVKRRYCTASKGSPAFLHQRHTSFKTQNLRSPAPPTDYKTPLIPKIQPKYAPNPLPKPRSRKHPIFIHFPVFFLYFGLGSVFWGVFWGSEAFCISRGRKRSQLKTCQYRCHLDYLQTLFTQSPLKGASKMAPREKCRKVSKIDDF